MYLDRKQLEDLTTQRLLAYKRKHFNRKPLNLPEEEVLIWEYTYEAILAILSKREHIERKKRGPYAT